MFVCSPDQQPLCDSLTSTPHEGQSFVRMLEVVFWAVLHSETKRIISIVCLQLTLVNLWRVPLYSATLAPHTDAQSLYRA
jgi:hypothetical protein